MKLSKELLLQAINAAFEFNAENDDASAMVSYDTHGMKLGLNTFSKDGGFTYYKISTSYTTDESIYANSHEENLEGFLDALKSHTSHV